MRGHLTALFLILLAAPVAAECAPTYRAAESRIERRVSAAAHVGFSTILIGCEADLRSLTDEEMSLIQRQLEKLADRVGIAIEVVMYTPKYRVEVVKEFNAALGRQVISDLFVFEIQLTEYRPR